jgi:hypothetical protein
VQERAVRADDSVKHLDLVKVGDQVLLRIKEALAITVVKP